MKEFIGKVGVITGGASGIGFALAKRCIKEGVKVVLADINKEDLEKAAAELKAFGGTVLSVQADVAKYSDVETMANKAFDAFGEVHLLFNNAGVAGGDFSPWETSLNDWKWRIGVNLWGVIHGVKVFTPLMLAQNKECHIVNTASVVGLMAYHPSASYHVSKSATVALSENLAIALEKINAPIKVSTLCPSAVKTRISDSERNRPAELQDKAPSAPLSQEYLDMVALKRAYIESGLPPEVVADWVFKAIIEEKFYILPSLEMKNAVQDWAEGIIQERNPRSLI